jgi:hypothetical protein
MFAARKGFVIRHWDLFRHSNFVIRHFSTGRITISPTNKKTAANELAAALDQTSLRLRRWQSLREKRGSGRARHWPLVIRVNANG